MCKKNYRLFTHQNKFQKTAALLNFNCEAARHFFAYSFLHLLTETQNLRDLQFGLILVILGFAGAASSKSNQDLVIRPTVTTRSVKHERIREVSFAQKRLPGDDKVANRKSNSRVRIALVGGAKVEKVKLLNNDDVASFLFT